MKMLSIEDYADEILLFSPYVPPTIEGYTKEKLVRDLLISLSQNDILNGSYDEQRHALYGIINTLMPQTLSSIDIKKLSVLLQLEKEEKNIVCISDMQTHVMLRGHETNIALWQGDISTLAADAIVNAANNQLLGCFHSWHRCIDNVIHSAAGVQLRDDCAVIMQKQGDVEDTGVAKITRAYNLPSRYVLHTVGPIVNTQVTIQNEQDLAHVYTSCLDLCKEVDDIRSIAFCSVSTGVFGYPPEEAAKMAIQTVKAWLQANPGHLDTVVFNVFAEKDKEIYHNLMTTK